MKPLTIVMYHYVRDLERSRFPGINARRTAEFIRQLDHLFRAGHNVVDPMDIFGGELSSGVWPPNPVWLTFDDGFIDHYATVLPILEQRRIKASFFPPACAIDGEMLPVHKIHFVLASTSPAVIVDFIRNSMSLEKFEGYWREHAVANRFDCNEVVFIKRMLQFALPDYQRSNLIDSLFHRFVTSDERAFAAELYMTRDQLRMMTQLGHHVGSHSVRHEWMDKMCPEDQDHEVVASLEFLKDIGAPTDRWVMCYPYGAHDDALLKTLRVNGCAWGVTSEARVADLDTDDPLLLPRMDTNDFPH